jgi:hypothetical protein
MSGISDRDTVALAHRVPWHEGEAETSRIFAPVDSCA